MNFFFAREEVHAIYERAAGKAGVRISHLDALPALTWGALIRARRDCAGWGSWRWAMNNWMDISIEESGAEVASWIHWIAYR